MKLIECHGIMKGDVPEIVYANTVLSKRSDLSPGTLVIYVEANMSSDFKGWH